MPQIETNSSKVDRKISIERPAVLEMTTVEELVAALGAEMAVNKIQAQLTVDFRAKVRGLLESKTDDELNYTDDEIIAMDFTDWKPEGRVRKSAEEKAAALFGSMSMEQIQAALALAGISQD